MKVAEARDKDIILRIYQDEMAESPRDWDNLGTMVCWHRNYNLGDVHEFNSPEYFQEWLGENGSLVLPLILLDHSGLSISTSREWPYNCPWDAGQVGWIYATYDKIREEYGDVSPDSMDKARKLLRSEVDTYDQYLQGDVYAFSLYKVEHCDLKHEHEEHIDGCCGFFGHVWEENGMIEHVGEEYRYLFDELEDC